MRATGATVRVVHAPERIEMADGRGHGLPAPAATPRSACRPAAQGRRDRRALQRRQHRRGGRAPAARPRAGSRACQRPALAVVLPEPPQGHGGARRRRQRRLQAAVSGAVRAHGACYARYMLGLARPARGAALDRRGGQRRATSWCSEAHALLAGLPGTQLHRQRRGPRHLQGRVRRGGHRRLHRQRGAQDSPRASPSYVAQLRPPRDERRPALAWSGRAAHGRRFCACAPPARLGRVRRARRCSASTGCASSATGARAARARSAARSAPSTTFVEQRVNDHIREEILRSIHASASLSFRGATIVGTGTYVPDRVLTNADLERMVETSRRVDRRAHRHPRAAHGGARAGALGPGADGGAQRALEMAGLDAARRRPDHRRHHSRPTASCRRARARCRTSWAPRNAAAFDIVRRLLRASSTACGVARGLIGDRARPTPCWWSASRRCRASSTTATATPACCSATAPARRCCGRATPGQRHAAIAAGTATASSASVLEVPAGGSRDAGHARDRRRRASTSSR